MNEEVAPYVYGQHQSLFYRTRQALAWLDKVGQYKFVCGMFQFAALSFHAEASDDERQVQAHIWASVLRKLPNITSFDCLLRPHYFVQPSPVWLDTIWNDEAVLEAIRHLAHVHFMLIEAASRVNDYGFNVPVSSFDPAFDKPFLETRSRRSSYRRCRMVS